MNPPEGLLPDGWTTDSIGRLRCPHHEICDPDGQAVDGCESPLLSMGLI
jgi:hypothetical protein